MLIDLIRLIYPNCCISCRNSLIKGEEILCLKCISSIPRSTSFRQREKLLILNDHKRILHFISLFEYGKNQLIQKLIHEFKYRNGINLAKLFGRELAYEIRKMEIGAKIDFLVPVPLTKRKRKIRGYNQSELIAKHLNNYLNKEILTKILKRGGDNRSQTEKSAYNRWQSIENSFQLGYTEELCYKYEGKHFLIIDDVVTTGSTIESCTRELLKIKDSCVSLAVVASA